MKKTTTSIFKKGFRAYYLLVVSIIVLTIAIQSIIQYSLKRQRSTALIVNLAGNQRTLSQRLLNEVYSCRFHTCDYAELKLSLHKLVQMNAILKDGSENLSIQAVEDPAILANFSLLKPHIDWFKTHLDDFRDIEQVAFDEMRIHTDGFLAIMDDIVLQFQKRSEGHIKGMMIVEVELAIFSVLIVLFEIFFIVNPIIDRIVNQKKKLGQIAWHQSHAFESHLKNVKDMQYVLRMEKDPRRQKEIVKFIVDEMDGLAEVSKNMQNALKENEQQQMPHDAFLEKIEVLLEKYKILTTKKKKINHGDRVRSEELKKPDTTVPQ